MLSSVMAAFAFGHTLTVYTENSSEIMGKEFQSSSIACQYSMPGTNLEMTNDTRRSRIIMAERKVSK